VKLRRCGLKVATERGFAPRAEALVLQGARALFSLKSPFQHLKQTQDVMHPFTSGDNYRLDDAHDALAQFSKGTDGVLN
jgi:hypothetical protein